MNKKEILWKLVILLLGLLACIAAGVGKEGLIFLAAAFFVSFPKFAVCRWYEPILGALASGVISLLAGGGNILFWGLLIVAAMSLSLTSIWKTILFTAMSGFMLWADVETNIYVAAFIGIIWNAILGFTYEKFYGKIET